MRFSTRRATRWTPFLTWFFLIAESWTDAVTVTDQPTDLHHPSTSSQTLQFYSRVSPTVPLRRSIRQASAPEFSWKPTKTPKFITSKVEKNPEPILRVYPPDIPHRAGRSREAPFQPEQPQSRSLGRRVIYYATLPDIPRAPTNVAPLDNRYVHYPMVVSNQQRSYNPKGGKEFVTKVSSSVIGIRPAGDKNKDSINSTPTFTIIDANTTPYSGSYAGQLPYNRVHVDYNMIGNVGDRPNFNYIPSYYNPTHPKNQFELLPPNFVKAQYPVVPYQQTPYYGNVDRTPYHQLAQYQQYQHQSSPYLYGNDVTKLPSPYHSPPYPSRHTRFPTDRYPIPSPLSQYNLGPPAPAPAAPASPPVSQSHQDFNDHNLNSFQQPGLGVNGPSPTVSSSLSDIDLNNNVGSLLDHSTLNLDDYNFPGGSPYRDKFPDFNTLGNKYFDFNSLSNELPFKFDKEPFKGTYSQVSDWLTNVKPFEPSGLDLEDATSGNRDYQIKGSSHAVMVDTQMQNVTTTVKDSNNTVITPFTSSNGNGTVQEERITY